MHSSASILRFVLMLKPAAASRRMEVARRSSPALHMGSNSFSSEGVQTPVICPAASLGAVLQIKRSRETAQSSSSMAARSFPSTYCSLKIFSAAAVSCFAIARISAAVAFEPAMPSVLHTCSTVTAPAAAEAHWSKRLTASRSPPSASRARKAAASGSNAICS